MKKLIKKFTGNVINSKLQQPSNPNSDESVFSDFSAIDLVKKEFLNCLVEIECARPVCGKILKSTDTGFKCYDCEQDPTCIICSDCMENSNHEGHRVVPQYQCSGCCDCGDLEAWDVKGCCNKHNGSIDKAHARNLLPMEIVNRICSIIEAHIYYMTQAFEISTIGIGVSYAVSLIDFCGKLGKKGVSYLLVATESLAKRVPSKYQFAHDCSLRKDRKKVDPHPCICSHLDLLFSNSIGMPTAVQKQLVDVFISFFVDFEFKVEVAKSYFKNFSFICHLPSKIHTLSVQLCTSDEVMSRVMEGDDLKNVFDILEQKELYTREYFCFEIWFHIKYLVSKPILAQKFADSNSLMTRLIGFLCFVNKFWTLTPRSNHINHESENSHVLQMIALEEEILDTIVILVPLLRKTRNEILESALTLIDDSIEEIGNLKTISIVLLRFVTLVIYKLKLDSPKEFQELLIMRSKTLQRVFRLTLSSLLFLRECENGKWVYYGDLPQILAKAYYTSKILSKFHIDSTAIKILFFSSQTEYLEEFQGSSLGLQEWLIELLLHSALVDHSSNEVAFKLGFENEEEELKSMEAVLSIYRKIKTSDFKNEVGSKYFSDFKRITPLFSKVGTFDSNHKTLSSTSPPKDPIFFLSDPNLYSKAIEAVGSVKGENYELSIDSCNEILKEIMKILSKQNLFPKALIKLLKAADLHANEELKKEIRQFVENNKGKFPEPITFPTINSSKSHSKIEEEVKCDVKPISRTRPSQADLISAFKAKQSKFLISHFTEELTEEIGKICGICREKRDGVFSIPFYFEKTNFALCRLEGGQAKGNPSIFRFSSCFHNFHQDCLSNYRKKKLQDQFFIETENHQFKCPECYKLSNLVLVDGVDNENRSVTEELAKGLGEGFEKELIYSIIYFIKLYSLNPTDLNDCRVKLDLQTYSLIFKSIIPSNLPQTLEFKSLADAQQSGDLNSILNYSIPQEQEEITISELRSLLIISFLKGQLPLNSTLKYFEENFRSQGEEGQFILSLLPLLSHLTISSSITDVSLLEIPLTYKSFNASVINTKCYVCNKLGSFMICLICGVTMCSPDCSGIKKPQFERIGNCTSHSMQYHAGTSIFLEFKSSSPLFISSSSNFLDSESFLYQDTFGQRISLKSSNWEDYILNPLLLSKLTRLLLSGTIGDEIIQCQSKKGMRFHPSYF